MTYVPLGFPPDYEYISKGPWFVTHVDDQGQTKSRVLHTLEGAVVGFWVLPSVRRAMIDAYGVTVMGTDRSEYPRMVGTREMMEMALDIVRRAPEMGLEEEANMLSMIDTIQANNGCVT